MCTSSTSRPARRVLETYAQCVVLTTLASSWLLRNPGRERYAHWVCTGLHRGTIAGFAARCPPSRGLRAHLYRESVRRAQSAAGPERGTLPSAPRRCAGRVEAGSPRALRQRVSRFGGGTGGGRRAVPEFDGWHRHHDAAWPLFLSPDRPHWPKWNANSL